MSYDMWNSFFIFYVIGDGYLSKCPNSSLGREWDKGALSQTHPVTIPIPKWPVLKLLESYRHINWKVWKILKKLKNAHSLNEK